MRTEAKSTLVAFLLSLIPGVGHLYIGRIFRFLLYAGGFFGPLGLLVIISIIDGRVDEEGFIILAGLALIMAGLNLIDMLVTIANGKNKAFQQQPIMLNGEYVEADPLAALEQQEKTKVMMLSIVPGLGHMYMGLLQRGMTLMILFVASFGVVLFLASVLTLNLLVFWLAMPIIWVYGMFDAMQLLGRKHKGEELIDQSLFVNMESHLASGQKNRAAAMVLSIFPGAGHLYLGLQQRGLQLMGLFLITVFVMDQLRLTLFFFLLPLLWCYAFFDILTQLRKINEQQLTDEPIITTFIPYQRWIGAGLLVVGLYYLLDRIAREWLLRSYPDLMQQYYDIKYMLPTVIISFVLILLGIRLLFGTTDKKSKWKSKEGS